MSRLPRGLTKTDRGWLLRVCVRGTWVRKRLPGSVNQYDAEIELIQIRKERHEPPAAPGSLEKDITRYLRDFYNGRPGYAERKRHLQLWAMMLGPDTPTRDLKRDAVSRVLNTWRAGGAAADTCNKRRTALLALFNALYGKGGQNPVREVPKFAAPTPLPRGLAYPLIVKALNKLPACKTRARLRVMAYTGVRHGQLMALTPQDWNRKQKTLLIPATRKGKGTTPHLVPLSPEAQAAMIEFDERKAWGTFTTAPMARLWKRAAMKVGLSKDVRPYDLRHSFGTQVFLATGDLKTTKDLMGHGSIRMTERYTLAAVPERQAVAINAFHRAVAPRRK